MSKFSNPLSLTGNFRRKAHRKLRRKVSLYSCVRTKRTDPCKSFSLRYSASTDIHISHKMIYYWSLFTSMGKHVSRKVLVISRPILSFPWTTHQIPLRFYILSQKNENERNVRTSCGSYISKNNGTGKLTDELAIATTLKKCGEASLKGSKD